MDLVQVKPHMLIIYKFVRLLLTSNCLCYVGLDLQFPGIQFQRINTRAIRPLSRGVLQKTCSAKFCKINKETPTTFSKRDYNTRVSLWISRNFIKHLRTCCYMVAFPDSNKKTSVKQFCCCCYFYRCCVSLFVLFFFKCGIRYCCVCAIIKSRILLYFHCNKEWSIFSIIKL